MRQTGEAPLSINTGKKMPFQISYDAYYAIVDFSTGDIVNASGEPVGQYGYREQTLAVGEIDRLKHSSELIVEFLDVDRSALYLGSRLDEANADMTTLRQKADDGSEYRIVKLTHKSYHYVTFDEIDS